MGLRRFDTFTLAMMDNKPKQSCLITRNRDGEVGFPGVGTLLETVSVPEGFLVTGALSIHVMMLEIRFASSGLTVTRQGLADSVTDCGSHQASGVAVDINQLTRYVPVGAKLA